MVSNARQGREARYPKDGCAEKLRGTSQEAKLAEIVRRQIVPGRAPLPASVLLVGGLCGGLLVTSVRGGVALARILG